MIVPGVLHAHWEGMETRLSLKLSVEALVPVASPAFGKLNVGTVFDVPQSMRPRTYSQAERKPAALYASQS